MTGVYVYIARFKNMHIGANLGIIYKLDHAGPTTIPVANTYRHCIAIGIELTS